MNWARHGGVWISAYKGSAHEAGAWQPRKMNKYSFNKNACGMYINWAAKPLVTRRQNGTDTSSPSPCSQQTIHVQHSTHGPGGIFLLIFHNKFLSLQCSKCHGIKSKVLVLTERNNMVFYLMQNDDFIIEKYGLQGRLVQRFLEKINAKKNLKFKTRPHGEGFMDK